MEQKFKFLNGSTFFFILTHYLTLYLKDIFLLWSWAQITTINFLETIRPQFAFSIIPESIGESESGRNPHSTSQIGRVYIQQNATLRLRTFTRRTRFTQIGESWWSVKMGRVLFSLSNSLFFPSVCLKWKWICVPLSLFMASFIIE